jgi:hypothetical protein
VGTGERGNAPGTGECACRIAITGLFLHVQHAKKRWDYHNRKSLRGVETNEHRELLIVRTPE